MYRVKQLVDLSDRTVSKVENHLQSPTLYTLLKMAKAQGIGVGELLTEIEKRTD